MSWLLLVLITDCCLYSKLPLGDRKGLLCCTVFYLLIQHHIDTLQYLIAANIEIVIFLTELICSLWSTYTLCF